MKQESATTANIMDKETYSENNKLIDIQEIQGTPFKLVKTGDTYFIAIGNNIVTERTDNPKELLEKIENKDWELLLNTVIAISLETQKEIKK